jgi:hypothetical protein
MEVGTTSLGEAKNQYHKTYCSKKCGVAAYRAGKRAKKAEHPASRGQHRGYYHRLRQRYMDRFGNKCSICGSTDGLRPVFSEEVRSTKKDWHSRMRMAIRQGKPNTIVCEDCY